MKKLAIVMLYALTLASCGGAARAKRPETQAATPAKVQEYTYNVKAVYPHSASSYTQGLQYHKGMMWEGTGQQGESRVLRTDLQTGRSEVLFRLPEAEFGEGIAIIGDTLYQLTWQSNTAHVYDLTKNVKVRDFRYPGEGWGLTTDGTKLYMSDGTPDIYTIDPATFRREKRTTVTLNGRPVPLLNELEWIEGRIWANIYTTDSIFIFNPATGVVEGIIDLSGLLPDEDRTPDTDVLNGIAYDAESERVFVTGKNWNKLFEIEIVKK